MGARRDDDRDERLDADVDVRAAALPDRDRAAFSFLSQT
jgi:hypothetical protein